MKNEREDSAKMEHSWAVLKSALIKAWLITSPREQNERNRKKAKCLHDTVKDVRLRKIAPKRKGK